MGCGRNICSITYFCEIISPQWIDASNKAHEQNKQNVLYPNVKKILADCKIFQLVEAKQEYEQFKDCPLAHIHRNGVMYIEFNENPVTEKSIFEWIDEATRVGAMFNTTRFLEPRLIFFLLNFVHFENLKSRSG